MTEMEKIVPHIEDSNSHGQHNFNFSANALSLHNLGDINSQKVSVENQSDLQRYFPHIDMLANVQSQASRNNFNFGHTMETFSDAGTMKSHGSSRKHRRTAAVVSNYSKKTEIIVNHDESTIIERKNSNE